MLPWRVLSAIAVVVSYQGCGGDNQPEELPRYGRAGFEATGIPTLTLGGPSGSGGFAVATAGRSNASGGQKASSTGKGGSTARGGNTSDARGARGGTGGSTSGGQGGSDLGPTAWGACPNTAPGDCEVVNKTIVVGSGETRDYKCKCLKANASTLGNGSQGESQQPVFRLENGAKLLNVILGSPAADGIHCYGDAALENIVWTDIGEDAMTIKKGGTVTLNGGYAANGSDKVFQINAPSTLTVTNFKAIKAGKFARQNGDTTFKISVIIDKCDISDMDESIFRTDSSSSTVKMTNTRYSHIGKQLFIVPNSSQVTASNNTEY
jgi:pectate lyase C